MTRRDTEHDEHPGARALRLHAAALPPVPESYEDLNARRCAGQTTRYGTVLDRHGGLTGWLYRDTFRGERPYFVRGTITTAKRRIRGSWHEVATWHTTGPRIYPIQVGDRIKFRVISIEARRDRWSNWRPRRTSTRDRPTAWRVVKSIDPIEVRLGGYGDYIVDPSEVLESEVRSC